MGNDPEEREDLAPEIPAPPEIKQVHRTNTPLTSTAIFIGQYVAKFCMS